MSNYVKNIESIFSKNANSEYALNMKKYMKNKSEFFGINSPLRRELCKESLRKENLPPIDIIRDIVNEFWKKPEREFQYFAMELLSKYSKQLEIDDYQLFEFMLTTKSWWDTVDYIASNLVGTHFKLFPELKKSISVEWMNSNNMWLQRTAILFQLKYKGDTDTELLFAFIKQLSSSSKFFIRKAIGWALREYSKTNPKSVKEFVQNNEQQLSGLSKREALKIINRR